MSGLEELSIYRYHILLFFSSLASLALYYFPIWKFAPFWLASFSISFLLVTFIVLDVTRSKGDIIFLPALYSIALLLLAYIYYLAFINPITSYLPPILCVSFFAGYMLSTYSPSKFHTVKGLRFIFTSLLVMSMMFLAFFGIFFFNLIMTISLVASKTGGIPSLFTRGYIDYFIASALPALGNLFLLTLIAWIYLTKYNLISVSEREDVGIKLFLVMSLVGFKNYLEFYLGLVVFAILHVYSIITSINFTLKLILGEFILPELGFVSWVELSSIIFLSYPLIVSPVISVSENLLEIYNEYAVQKVSRLIGEAEDHVIVIGHGKIGSTITRDIAETLRNLGVFKEYKFPTPYFKEIRVTNSIVVITDKETHLNWRFRHHRGETWGLVRIGEDSFAIAFIGDGTNIEVLRKLLVEKASLIISTIGQTEALDPLIRLSKMFGLEDKLVLVRMPTLTREYTITTIETFTNVHTFSKVTLLANFAGSFFVRLLKYFIIRDLGRPPRILFMSSSEKTAINIRSFIRIMMRNLPRDLLNDNIYILAPFNYYLLNARRLDASEKINIGEVRCGGDFYKVRFFESPVEIDLSVVDVNLIFSKPNSYCIYSALKAIKPDVVIVAEDTNDDALSTLSDLLISLQKIRVEGGEEGKPYLFSIYPYRDENILNLIEKHQDLLSAGKGLRALRDTHIDGLSVINSYIMGIVESYLIANRFEKTGFISLNLMFRDNYNTLLKILASLAGLKPSQVISRKPFTILLNNNSLHVEEGGWGLIRLSSQAVLTEIKELDAERDFRKDIWTAIVSNYVQKTPKIEPLRTFLGLEMGRDTIKQSVRIDELETVQLALDTIRRFEEAKRGAIQTNYVYINPNFPQIKEPKGFRVEDLCEIERSLLLGGEREKLPLALIDLRLYSFPGSLSLALSDLSYVELKEDNGKETILDIAHLQVKDILEKIGVDLIKLKEAEFHGIILSRKEAIRQSIENLKRMFIYEDLGGANERTSLPSIQALRILPMSQEEIWEKLAETIALRANRRLNVLPFGRYFYLDKGEEKVVFFDPLVKGDRDAIKVDSVTPGFCLFLMGSGSTDPFTYIAPRIMISPSIIELYHILKRCRDGLRDIDCVEGETRFSLLKMSLNRLLYILEKTGNTPLYLFIFTERKEITPNSVAEAVLPRYLVEQNNSYRVIKGNVEFRGDEIVITLSKSLLSQIYRELTGVELEIRERIRLNSKTVGRRISEAINFYHKIFEEARIERIRLQRRGEYWPQMIEKPNLEMIKDLSRCDALTFTLAEKIFNMPTILPPDLTALPYTTAKRHFYEEPHLTFL